MKIVLRRLIENCQEDEEIVVTDGASTDGTPEYLKELYEQGKIHQYISEKDAGEAHGYNKAMLMAKGELIKIITDDDVFYYPLIKECKKFMLENTQFDLLSGNIADMKDGINTNKRYEDDNFLKYKNEKKSFYFNGQPIFIRRRSLPLIGLLDTNFITVDVEFALRLTSNKKIKLCWLTDFLSVRIDNSDSNYNKFRDQIIEQADRLLVFYNKKEEPITEIDDRPFYKRTWPHKVLLKIYWSIKSKPLPEVHIQEVKSTVKVAFEQAFLNAEKWIEDDNKNKKANIIY